MKTRMLTLIILFLGFSAQGQELEQYFPDTVWFKTGEVLPCKIASTNPADNLITIQYYDSNGVLAYEPMSFDLVSTYVIGPEINPNDTIAEEWTQAIPDSLKSMKAYFGVGFGYPSTAGVSFTAISKNNWGASISYKHTSFSKCDRSNKTGGVFGPGSVPGDQFDEYALCVVKDFPSRNPKGIVMSLEAGPSLVKYERVDRTSLTSLWILGTYYSSETSMHNIVGLSLRAKARFPLTPVFGFEIALYGNLNSLRSHGGIEIYISLGKVRDSRRKKKTIKNSNTYIEL